MVQIVLVVLAIIGMVTAQPPPPDASCFQPTAVTAEECCKMPKPIDTSVMEKCRASNPLPSQMPAPGVPRTEGCCVMQCALTETGGFVNNALNTDAIKKFVTSSIGSDANFGPILNGAVDSCARQVQNDPAYSAPPVSASPDRPGCSFIPQGFINCLTSTMFKSCPASVWTESSDCQALKSKLNNGCPFFSLMGRGPKN